MIEHQKNTETSRKTRKLLEGIMLEAGYSAGNYVNNQAFIYKDLEWKKTDDPVTEADRHAENMIKSAIRSSGVPVNFYGEEEGVDDQGHSIDIFIDPIDGTKSYSRGEFLSSVSIAASENGELFFGCVYDFMRDLMYFANEDGAYMRRKMWTSDQKLPNVHVKFSKPSIAFSESTGYEKILRSSINPRKQIGSMALNMAQLAAGSYEGLIMKSKKKSGITDTCDIAAGYYVMKQSGIYIKDYDLEEYDYRNPSNGIIALKPEYKSLLKM